MQASQLVSQHRTQVYFPNDLYRAVKERAKKEDSSIAQVIRKAVEKEVAEEKHINQKEREKVWKEFMKAAGIGNSKLGDLSVHHDKYFDPFSIKTYRKKKTKV